MKCYPRHTGLLVLIGVASFLSACDSSSTSAEDPAPSPEDSTSVIPSGTVVAPSFSPAGGTYSVAQTVTLSSTTPGAEIHYTTDGTAPTAISTKYSTPISVGVSQTVKAIAIKSGMTSSSIASAGYTISLVVATTGSVTSGGQTYKTVKIGSQNWMAENLNSSGPSGTTGVCYGNSADSCTKYGRLYTWTEAMSGAVSSSASPSGVQGLCPTGWHIPSDPEWTALYTYAGRDSAAARLKSKTGWALNNGTDKYGFNALPGGYYKTDGPASLTVGMNGYFWTSTQMDIENAWSRMMFAGGIVENRLPANYTVKFSVKYSLRCVEN